MDDITIYTTPLPVSRGRQSNKSRAELFWSKVNKDGPVHPVLGTACWVWTASRYSSGYGQFWEGTYLTGAHRFVNILTYGPIPDGIVILHRCDNKLCCNPAHHLRGTCQDNVDDLHAKGLNRQPRGERQRSHKFTEEQVRQIRETYATGSYTHAALARKLGVTAPTIRSIVQHLTWTHI